MSKKESNGKLRVAGWVERVWSAKDCCEWTYKRPEGDLVVYAMDEIDALETLRNHGFRKLDSKNLVRTGSTLAERLGK
jgi:hypothetical protein